MNYRHLFDPLVCAAKSQKTPETAAGDTAAANTLESLIQVHKKFRTIYADPPWKYGNQATRSSTNNHYVTMSLDEICALPISQLADTDAQLHLWTTNGFLQDAFRVIDEWGFSYRSCFVWVKPQMGIGNYWRVSHEFLLTAIRGSASFVDKGLKSWAELSRAKHSKKPDEIRKMVERAYHPPRLELFARQRVDGWTVWGNEVRA